MGHIMRCLALARGIEGIGARAVFVIRNYSPGVTVIIKRYGYSVETIAVDATWKEDLSLTLGYADGNKSGLIITDLGNYDNTAQPEEYCRYLQGLKDSGKYLVTIDDLAKASLPADIVINPHFGAEKTGYDNRTGTRYLLGPDYFIFRPEFIAAAGMKREIRDDARNVLIALGGSDPTGIVGRVAGAVVKSDKTRGLDLCIVLGMDYPEPVKKSLESILKDYPGHYELIQGSDNMAELMLWSDITVTGGGLTKYEVAVTGTPCIIIPQYDYLNELAKVYEKTGAALNLGNIDIISDDAVAGAIAGLLEDTARRAEMSQKGCKLSDGRGIERILAEIPAGAWS